jgi:hypothetical protein
MVTRILLGVSLLIVGCSQQPSRRDDSAYNLLNIDSAALASFSERVAGKYSIDSRGSSWQSLQADSIDRPLPSPFSPTSRIRLNGSYGDTVVIALYSFDRQDSCILFKGLTVLNNAEFDIGHYNLPIGNYFLKVVWNDKSDERRFFFLR